MLFLDLRLTKSPGRARLAFQGHEVAAHPVDERTEGRLGFWTFVRLNSLRAERPEIRGEHGELRVAERPLSEQRVEIGVPRRVKEDVGEPLRGAPAGDFRRQVARTEREKALQDIGGHETAAEKRRQALTQLPLVQLQEHQGQIGVGLRLVAADPERAIECFADEPRNLGLVGQVEARLDVSFERELADERQAECVDGRDRDLAEPLAQRFPARCRQLGRAAGLFQPLDNPLPHFGGGFPGERDGEDVLGCDAGQQQVDVAFDQHSCLAGARRGLENDVA